MTRHRGPVDWDEIRRRVSATEAALAPEFDGVAQEERRAARLARAQALALGRSGHAHRGPGLDLVEFMLAEHRYAIDATCVCDVRHLSELTGVPCTPSFVSGIINSHGRIIAVIDLLDFLGLAAPGLGDLDKVVIVQQEDVELGLLADRILGTRWMPLEQLVAAPEGMTGARAKCVRGLAPQQAMVLDAPRLLADVALALGQERIW